MRTTKAAKRFVQTVGSNIRAGRKAAQLTQTTFGRKLGIDAPTVSRIESGARDLRTSELYEISRAINSTPAALVADEPTNN